MSNHFARVFLSVFVLSALLISAGYSRLEAAEKSKTQTELESIAAQLPCFCTQDFLYNRMLQIDSGSISQEEEGPYRKFIAELISMDADTGELLPLLKHPDPKVRTLAMAKLVMKEDPKILPDIVPLADDPAPTFPNPKFPERPPPAPGEFVAEEGVGPPPRDQTVGTIATAVVNLYLEPAGFEYGIEGSEENGGFVQYWEQRKGRAYCGSWFVVQLLRATRGTMEIPSACIDGVRRVRARVDQLPKEDRAWMLLWLNHGWAEKGDPLANIFVTEDELVKIGQSLGPEKLLLALRGRIPSDDPDLQPRSGAGPGGFLPLYETMQEFILRHAQSLLRPGDADALLAQKEKKSLGGSPSPWWAIAAAQLQPGRAEHILRDEYPIFKGKWNEPELNHVGVALWSLAGESQGDFLTDWYYREVSELSPNSIPNPYNSFIDDMAKTETPSGRKLLAKILDNTRYASLDWQSVQHLADAVNGWLPAPLVSQDELNAIDRGGSPELKIKLLDRLRASVPQWNK